MNTVLRRSLAAALLLSCFAVARANDYKSAVLQPGQSLSSVLSSPINVPDDRFLVIRNFTQNGGSNRGTVTVTIGSQSPVTVLTASILTDATLEPVNSIVIAGPATVDVTCGSDATTCFVSYRKQSE